MTDTLARVVPQAPRFFPHQIQALVGYPERQPAVQAALLRVDRGDDTAPRVIEAPSSEHSAPHILITPLSIFPVEQIERDERLCFVIMPFARAFTDVYQDGIKKAIDDAELLCVRADDIQEPGHILGQIWVALLKARFVIADLTGGNSNVLYELGLAHALGHPAILLTQDEKYIPFDLRPQRRIDYDPTRLGVERLRNDLAVLLRHLVK